MTALAIAAAILLAAALARSSRMTRAARRERDEAESEALAWHGSTQAAIRNADIIDEQRVAEIERLTDELAWSRHTICAVVQHQERHRPDELATRRAAPKKRGAKVGVAK